MLIADFLTAPVGNCAFQDVYFYRDSSKLGLATPLTATRYAYTVNLTGLASSNYYSAKANLVNANGSFLVETTASRIKQIVLNNPEKINMHVLLYPSPNSGLFRLKSSSLNVEFKVYDQLGKQVYFDKIESNDQEFDLSFLNAGIYSIKIDNLPQVLKLVKN
jgi:hypothetical protein